MNWPLPVPVAPNCCTNSPLELNSWTRLWPESATQTLPAESVAVALGAARLPGPEPVPPNWRTYSPAATSSTLLLAVSATQMLPLESTLRPFGSENWPSVVAGFAELGKVGACRAELLNAVVAGVGDPDVAGGVGGDPLGRLEFPIAGAFFADRPDEFAFGVELLDSLVVGVGDPEVGFGVDRHGLRFLQLAVFGAVGEFDLGGVGAFGGELLQLAV